MDKNRIMYIKSDADPGSTSGKQVKVTINGVEFINKFNSSTLNQWEITFSFPYFKGDVINFTSNLNILVYKRDYVY
jgi:hypothetical protein